MKILYWIDDTHDDRNPPNKGAKLRLEQGLNVSLDVRSIGNRDQFDKFLPTIDPKKTCGVIMDYQLSKVGENGQMAYGSTWAAEIRAAYNTVPVIGISHERPADIPVLRLESFLAFFPREELIGAKPPFKNIASLLKGYSQVCQSMVDMKTKSGVERMAELISSPITIAEQVKAAIPTQLRGLWDAETPHVASRWIWHELQGRPGFLFDELGLATHLGLKTSGLARVIGKFDATRYRGTLASDDRPRWWVTGIRPIFEKIVGDKTIGPISDSRDKLLSAFRIPKSERATMLAVAYPRKSTSEIPDCVAYKDDEREENDRVQALGTETILDERDSNLPFGFEARRIYSK